MRANLRPALALVCAGALSLLCTAPITAGDRATDPVGDAPRPGLDITAVTTTVTEVDVTFEVELAGDWTYAEDSQLHVNIGTRPQDCGFWRGGYNIQVDASGIEERSSFARRVALAVDGPSVSIVVPLDGMRDPQAIWFLVMTQDWNVIADDPRAGVDIFPDGAWDRGCREVALIAEAPSPSPSPSGPVSAARRSDAGPWQTVLPVTLLVAVAGLLLYDWRVAEQRWRGPSTRTDRASPRHIRG